MQIKLKQIVIIITILFITLGLINCGQDQWDPSKVKSEKGADKPDQKKKSLDQSTNKKEIPTSSDETNVITDDFPEYKGYLNDYAKILSSDYSELILTMLSMLDEEMGIQAVVITISTVNKYSNSKKDIREFASSLLKKWGIGEKTHNGALILFSLEDQKCFIALGDKYDKTYNSVMEQIIEKKMNPYFKKNEYSEGIYAGVTEIIMELTKTGLDNTKGNKINENKGVNIASEKISADQHRYGIGVAGNQFKAFELYKKAASEGDVNAMVELSEYYKQGIWVKRDHKKAIQLLKQAAAAGSLSAKWQLEFMGIEE